MNESAKILIEKSASVKTGNVTHGQARKGNHTKEYRAWRNMRNRCRYPSFIEWERYGGRGIRVCDRWMNSFENFFSDMGRSPKGTSLDRIDNDGDYCRSNCRWASRIEQMSNKSNNRFLEFDGKKMTIYGWSKFLGCKSQSLFWRINNGWDVGTALTKPMK